MDINCLHTYTAYSLLPAGNISSLSKPLWKVKMDSGMAFVFWKFITVITETAAYSDKAWLSGRKVLIAMKWVCRKTFISSCAMQINGVWLGDTGCSERKGTEWNWLRVETSPTSGPQTEESQQTGWCLIPLLSAIWHKIGHRPSCK